MGNFEKLGVLVLITLVVVILVLLIWGMNVPTEDLRRDAQGRVAPISASGNGTETDRREAGNGRGGVTPDPDPEPRPTPWPDPDPEPSVPVPPIPIPDPNPHPGPGPVPVPSPDLTHEVKRGESLYGIAKLYYRDGKYFRVILEANEGLTADINPGMKIVIPNPRRVLDAPARPIDPPVPERGRTYVVKGGDSLWSIAVKFLGSGPKYKRIHDANRTLLGADPGSVRKGMVLVIPE